MLKSDVDSHIPGETSVFPHCQLSAECSVKRKKVPKLSHRINMIGAKEPHTYFVINMDPYMIVKSSGNVYCASVHVSNCTLLTISFSVQCAFLVIEVVSL